mmetsp:Transcript_97054/g.302139  ORF Transcript_97054/g.302139 Transcript_97054/m.302139 type:complete len:139 (+) Transcript_97054:77-493(+)
MAVRRPVLCALVLAAAALWALHAATSPAFAGARPAAGRQPRVAARAEEERKYFEIFVTQPSVGERTRMTVTKETTVDYIITECRKLLGFDQDWIPDSDFKLYEKGDDDKVLTGTMGDHNVRQWGPDGLEVHLMFEPSS